MQLFAKLTVVVHNLWKLNFYDGRIIDILFEEILALGKQANYSRESLYSIFPAFLTQESWATKAESGVYSQWL